MAIREDYPSSYKLHGHSIPLEKLKNTKVSDFTEKKIIKWFKLRDGSK